MSETPVEATALALVRAHGDRIRQAPLPAERLGDVAFAYAVQDRLVARRQQGGAGHVAGWKIGMTTATMQAMTGLAEPASGAILADGLWSSGATLPGADFMHLGLEGEIAVRLSEAFPETDAIDPAQVLGRLESVAAVFEVTDDRHADWTQLDAASLIADDIWNRGLVVGPPAPAALIRRLTGRRGVVSVNGEVRDEGMSEDIGCDPLWIIAWLGAHLARRGRPLQPGQWVSTGSFVPTTFPQPGDRYRFAVDGLEPVDLVVA